MSSAGQQGDMPPSSSSAPRRRGANKLKRVQEATQPLVVESNTYGQPCNDEECPLARFIGLLIRDPNLVSINVKDWRKVPNDRKEMLYDTICAKFSGLEGPKVKKWVIGKMGELFRGWRQEIRDSHFDPDMPLHEQYIYFDHRVDPDQWRQYVDYLHTPEAKVISERNKANRGKLTMSHTAGTKPYCRYRAEQQRAHPAGEEPDRLTFWTLTHTKRDGTLVDEASERVMRQVNEIMTQRPDSSASSIARNEIFTQVMGPDTHGRVRTYGHGVTPTDMRVAGATSHSERLQRQLDASEARHTASEAALMAMIQSQGEIISSLQGQVTRMQGIMDSFQRNVNNMSTFSENDTDKTLPPDATQH